MFGELYIRVLGIYLFGSADLNKTFHFMSVVIFLSLSGGVVEVCSACVRMS